MARSFTAASSEKLSRTTAVVSGPPLTMACWGYPTDNTIVSTLMSLGHNSSANCYILDIVGTIANDPFRLYELGGTTDSGTFINNPTFNAWSHFCGVFASSSSRTSYLNGSATAGGTNNIGTSTLNRTTIGAVYFGADPPVNFLSGRVAEAGIWNAALTAEEVAALAAGYSPLFIRPQSLVSYWPLFARATDEEDWVGGNTLTASGTSAVEHPRIIRPRSALYFLGTAEATTTVTPSVGSIIVAGNTPTLVTNTIQQPAAGAVIVTGNAPNVVENLILQPSSGTVVVSGFAPTLQIGADTTAQPGVGSVIVAGLAPTLLEKYIVQPAAGSVVVSGLEPSLKFEQRFNPETGTIVVTGLAPTLVQNVIAQPGAGTIIVEGLAPNAGTGAFTAPAAGTIVVEGLAPTVTATAHVTLQPDAGQIIVSGLTPTIIDSGLLSAEQLAQLYGGNIFTGKKKKKKKPELEEMIFEVAKTTAGKKEIIHVLPKSVQEELPDPQLALVSDLVQKIEAASAKVQKEVERIYKKRRDDDEDDIFILLM